MNELPPNSRLVKSSEVNWHMWDVSNDSVTERGGVETENNADDSESKQIVGDMNNIIGDLIPYNQRQTLKKTNSIMYCCPWDDCDFQNVSEAHIYHHYGNRHMKKTKLECEEKSKCVICGSEEVDNTGYAYHVAICSKIRVHRTQNINHSEKSSGEIPITNNRR